MDAKKAEIDNFFIEVKKSDKDFDEQEFSEFVLKHSKDKEDVSLADIKSFFSVYKELGEAKKLGEESALKNKGNRTEKVSGKTGEGGSEVDFSDLRGKGDIRDIAREAYQRSR